MYFLVLKLVFDLVFRYSFSCWCREEWIVFGLLSPSGKIAVGFLFSSHQTKKPLLARSTDLMRQNNFTSFILFSAPSFVPDSQCRSSLERMLSLVLVVSQNIYSSCSHVCGGTESIVSFISETYQDKIESTISFFQTSMMILLLYLYLELPF